MSIRKYKVTTEYKEYKEFIVSELEFSGEQELSEIQEYIKCP